MTQAVITTMRVGHLHLLLSSILIRGFHQDDGLWLSIAEITPQWKSVLDDPFNT